MSDDFELLPSDVEKRIVSNHDARQIGWAVVVDDPSEDGDKYIVGPFTDEDQLAEYVSGILTVVRDDGGDCEVLPIERPMTPGDVDEVFNPPA